MNTTIEHKHPIGTTLRDPDEIEWKVIGVRQTAAGDYYEMQCLIGQKNTQRVLVDIVERECTAVIEPLYYLNVYRDEAYPHKTRELAQANMCISMDTRPDDIVGVLAVFDDGVEVIEGARGGGTGVAS